MWCVKTTFELITKTCLFKIYFCNISCTTLLRDFAVSYLVSFCFAILMITFLLCLSLLWIHLLASLLGWCSTLITSPLWGATIIYRVEYFIYFPKHCLRSFYSLSSEPAVRETGIKNSDSALKMLIVYHENSPVCPRDEGQNSSCPLQISPSTDVVHFKIKQTR